MDLLKCLILSFKQKDLKIIFIVILSMLITILYTLMPIDILPDAIPVFGTVDDLFISVLALGKMYKTIYKKISDNENNNI